ncbi:MAG: 3-methyl-2-oxobutanoate dehydrogenase subunit VorB [Ignavibacteriales bacterium]|nr:3-methyl-2-oxobutanoate dehydrogenase subunit VorB [Ignavibacteriales bacterium]
MSEIRLMKGNEAVAEAAIRAGCDAYFGYPITPQSEIIEYLSDQGRKRGMIVMQVESEVAAINMIYGAAGAGARAMTTSSSPGMSLMQEGISYIACAELPCLLMNVNRGGPGLGTIQPSQGDYFQSVKGGGHGDYHLIVLAPASVQEMADFVYLGFDLADKYRNPVLILTDGALGQMMEKVIFPEYDPKAHKPPKPWATVGKSSNRSPNVITSLHLHSDEMENINIRLQEKYRKIEANEVRYELMNTEDADVIMVAYGLTARICQRVIELAKQTGIKIGLMRPISLYPYPFDIIAKLSEQVGGFFVVEMNAGQMIEDVRLGVNGKVPVGFYGRMGGVIPTAEEILHSLQLFMKSIAMKEKV